jgi:predicted transcriptional regulator
MSVRGAKIDLSKRGRPKGTLNGFADKTKKWQPKKWKPLYEVIVSMHVQGYVNKFIADKLQITPQTVSNVINCDMARGVIVQMMKKVQELSAEKSADLVAQSVDLIHKRIHGALNNAVLAKSSPLAVGAFAIKAGQAMGILKDPVNILNNPEVAQGLMTALSKSQEAAQLHSGISGESIGVISREFEPVIVTDK